MTSSFQFNEDLRSTPIPLKQTIEVSVQRAYGANKSDNKYMGYTKVRMINARKNANALVGAPRAATTINGKNGQ